MSRKRRKTQPTRPRREGLLGIPINTPEHRAFSRAALYARQGVTVWARAVLLRAAVGREVPPPEPPLPLAVTGGPTKPGRRPVDPRYRRNRQLRIGLTRNERILLDLAAFDAYKATDKAHHASTTAWARAVLRAAAGVTDPCGGNNLRNH